MLGENSGETKLCKTHHAGVGRKDSHRDSTNKSVKDLGQREEELFLTESWGKSGENYGRKKHWIGVL